MNAVTKSVLGIYYFLTEPNIETVDEFFNLSHIDCYQI